MPTLGTPSERGRSVRDRVVVQRILPQQYPMASDMGRLRLHSAAAWMLWITLRYLFVSALLRTDHGSDTCCRAHPRLESGLDWLLGLYKFVFPFMVSLVPVGRGNLTHECVHAPALQGVQGRQGTCLIESGTLRSEWRKDEGVRGPFDACGQQLRRQETVVCERHVADTIHVLHDLDLRSSAWWRR